MPFVNTVYKTLSSFLIKWQIKSNEYSHVQINKLEWVLSNPSETHSHLEKELALWNDGFINKLLKPELPCTPTRQSSPVRTRFEPKAHRVSTGTPSELEASFYMEQGTALAARNEFGMRLDSDLADPLMFRIGPFLVTGLLYLVGVQGNSG